MLMRRSSTWYETRHGMAWHGMKHGMKHGMEWHDMVLNMAGHGMKHSMAWHDTAWHGIQRPSSLCIEYAAMRNGETADGPEEVSMRTLGR
eukprot:355016-Chlamydomonas_euryale.AAC.2